MPSRAGGRPRFQATAELRRTVNTLHAAGASIDRIAHAIRISVPTLRRYFPAELGVKAETERKRKARARVRRGERRFPLTLPCEGLRELLVTTGYIEGDEAFDIEMHDADYRLARQRLEDLIADLLRGRFFLSQRDATGEREHESVRPIRHGGDAC